MEMKYIKKFYPINELKDETYKSAADGLSKMGGLHKKRGEELEKWVKLKKTMNIGTFNMNAHILKYPDGHYPPGKFKDGITISKLIDHRQHQDDSIIKKSPNDFYISSVKVILPSKEVIEKEEPFLLYISFNAIPIDFNCEFQCLQISVEVDWDIKDNLFYISSDDWYDKTIKVSDAIFADRKSAIKFKKILCDPKNLNDIIVNIDEIKDLFFEYSTSGYQLECFLKIFSSLPTNILYQ